MNQRELAELRSLFGRSAVDDVIAHQSEALRWAWEHPEATASASRGLMAVISDPQSAVAYATSLDYDLKRALIVALLNV